MTEEKQKYKNNALIGTLIFHGLLLLGFIYFGLSTPLPLPEEEGVLVNLGYTESGAGQRQPLTSSPPPPQPEPAQSDQATEDIATQNTEETVALPDSEQDREQPREDTQQDTPQPAEESTQEEVQPEPEPEPQVDPRAMFPGRDRRTTESQNQGEGGAPGNQGRPDGTTDGTATDGGGQGDGVEFSLAGRSANNLPLPDYTTQSQGKVVVRIWVDRNGQVTRAEAGARGTTTSDQALWREAEIAARKASFDSKSDAAHEQQGTITYNFIRLN